MKEVIVYVKENCKMVTQLFEYVTSVDIKDNILTINMPARTMVYNMVIVDAVDVQEVTKK